MDLDELIDGLRQGKIIPIKDLGRVCEKLKEIFVEESNVQVVSAPVTICARIHGQLSTLLEIFRRNGEIPLQNYIFLGGYVNYGTESVQVMQLLLCLKLKYPGHITLIRDRLETRNMSWLWGFQREIERKYHNLSEPLNMFMDIFDYFPLAALVDGKVFCVSSGLSPELRTLDQIRLIYRQREIPERGPFSDLVWSDPDPQVEGWKPSLRGVGFLFGQDVVAKFNFLNNLEFIARSQFSMSGYKYPYEEDNLVSLWSTFNPQPPALRNSIAVLGLDEHLHRTFHILCPFF